MEDDELLIDELIKELEAQQLLEKHDIEEVKKEIASPKKEDPDEKDHVDIRHKIAAMTVGQKIKEAVFGGAISRALLIQEPNKLIQECVLKHPRIQIQEVEGFLKSTTTTDFVIRKIAQSKEWMRNYSMKSALVSNPKTPQDISLKWLRFLSSTDIKKLARSKNVPNTVSSAASRLVAASENKK